MSTFKPPIGGHAVEEPLWHAERELEGVRKNARLGLAGPPFLLVFGFLGVMRIDPTWMKNPVMVLILALFVVGQIMLWRHLVMIRKGATSTLSVINLLREAGSEPDLALLRTNLMNHKDGPTRDLVLRWVNLGLQGILEGSDQLIENSSERRFIRDQKLASLHISVNRNILKIGFMGTLIGLLLTFPPMKRAVLGLSDSAGEMGFIRDIASAIDHDAYAIMATLVATGFSILLEAVVVQALERILTRFEIADRHLADWNVTRLQPMAVRIYEARHAAPSGTWRPVASAPVMSLPQTREQMDAHFQLLLDTIGRTGETVEAVARAQAALSSRIEKLLEFESHYRQFLATKAEAIAPAKEP
ncbi:MAG: hypothetical protein RL318_487 [Fibrobacterota bacterium]|jgi:hypothetical protein